MDNMEQNISRDEQGRLLPGHAGLKPKGASNHLQSVIKEKITDFLNGKLNSIEEIYAEVTPKEKLRFINELLSFVIPKCKEITKIESNKGAVIDYSRLSEGALKEVLKYTTINQDDSKRVTIEIIDRADQVARP